MARAGYANHADVAHAMSSESAPRGNAVDAVVHALFCYAAVEPSLLLGPLQMLIGGPGAGLHVVDGRVRQPGLGAPRPRGFVDAEAIPAAATVGVPCFAASALVALTNFGTCTINQAVSPAAELALGLSKERAAVLKLFAQQGPMAQTQPSFAGVLIERFGRMQGGLLTAEDLQPQAPPMMEPVIQPLDVNEYRAAVSGDAVIGDELRLHGRPALMMAVDHHGLFCAAVANLAEGVLVPELDLVAPGYAVPVRRGVERPKVGSAVPAPAPMALLGRGGVWEMAMVGNGRLSAALQAVEGELRHPGEGMQGPQPQAHLLFGNGTSRTL